MALNYKPTALIILDGFGIAPPCATNAVSVAKKPFFDSLIQTYPSMLLEASGINVGLPYGEVGNSEVGHITIGSGILRYQSLPRINKSISTGQFFKINELRDAFKKVKDSKAKLHLIGLIGNGGVHSSQAHLEALISLAKKYKLKDRTFLHVFTDGRDTAKDVGKIFLQDLLKYCKKSKTGIIATMGGRYYGMDRNKSWDRTQLAYNAIVNGQAKITDTDPLKAIKKSYAKKIYDEELEPIVFVNKKNQPLATIEDGDVVIYFNFRADRARQLTQALVLPNFKEFETKKLKKMQMITFTEYEKNLPVTVLFPPETISSPLAKIFSDYNLNQLHIAETEKYAHVTFFFNGMIEEPFAGEKRILIPSPDVPSYDKKPEMSAEAVTAEILKALKTDKYDFMAINYANTDMVGHTGDLKAAVKSTETVDKCLAQIVPAILKKNGAVFIVGDHGNAEELVNLISGEIDKEHNVYPVPFIVASNNLVGKANKQIVNTDMSLLTPVGILSDVAPTILQVIGLSAVNEMTGKSLL